MYPAGMSLRITWSSRKRSAHLACHWKLRLAGVMIQGPLHQAAVFNSLESRPAAIIFPRRESSAKRKRIGGNLGSSHAASSWCGKDRHAMEAK